MGKHIRRRMKVYTMALIVYFDYKMVQLRQKWTRKPKIPDLWKKAHERNAQRVLNFIVELEGLWIKLGQYLSTRTDVLPGAYIALLKQLQDSLLPRPFQEVCGTIQEELGKSMDGIFSDFMKDPLATALIAQVHRATLLNGREVAVKVQHKGIKTIMLEDLKNAKSIVDWIAWAEPQYNFNPMLDEWCKEAPKELDFNLEAENTRIVSRNLGCKSTCDNNMNGNQVHVLIPEVIQSTEKILILEYMDGIRLNDTESLETIGVNKQKIVEEITRAYAHQIYVDGFFNGDPHPGNFLVSKESPHLPILLNFGLTKRLSSSFKQALAKIFLASAEGDHVALLSAFAEMGLKLRLDIPEQAMDITTIFFCSSTTAKESSVNMKSLTEQRNKNMKVIQEKINLNKEEVKCFNPVDAFPGDIVIFSRVLNLLRGMSSTMDVLVVYLDIMRPFAEYVLQGNIISIGPMVNDSWIYDTPVHSQVEIKLRQLLVDLGNKDKIIGIQVCAYKDGEVIVDTAAGVLGRYDPRPVQPDSLFSVFSATKGITAGMLHWLVDIGKLKLDENVQNIWPEFGSNGKNLIKVHHVLNHTSGLHNAMGDVTKENPLLLCDWETCLKCIAMLTPETEPGQEQLYHYMSFGWLCGGIIEHASGKKFQEVLEEAFIRPLNIDGELYIGIPPGVESRLASLTPDIDDLQKVFQMCNRADLPSTFQPDTISELATTMPAVFNRLDTRRAIVPAANGHCSARALARYYAALVDGGSVPLPHSSFSKPPLGSHPHIPKFSSIDLSRKQKGQGKNDLSSALKTKNDDFEQTTNGCKDLEKDFQSRDTSTDRLIGETSSSTRNDTVLAENMPGSNPRSNYAGKIFKNRRIHDAFLGTNEYANLIKPDGKFGLGFKRYNTNGGFGHSGMGGSTGFCDIKNRFAIAVTLNKISSGSVTGQIVQLICSELNIPLPDDYSRTTVTSPDAQLNPQRLLIN